MTRKTDIDFGNILITSWKDVEVFLKIRYNHLMVIKKVDKEKEYAHLTFIPFQGGHVSHYYHFLFDLLWPLSTILEKIKSTRKISLNDIGPLSKHLTEIYPNKIVLRPADCEIPALSVLGMNPIAFDRIRFNLRDFSNNIIERVMVDAKSNNKIVILQRFEPDLYYKQTNYLGIGGNLRRSILNHNDLVEIVKIKFGNRYIVENVILENLSIKDQILIFRSAAIVIGQHGAGLSNIIWMHPNCVVMEFGFQGRGHFVKISKSMRLKHHIYKDFDEAHITIDLEHFLIWMEELI